MPDAGDRCASWMHYISLEDRHLFAEISFNYSCADEQLHSLTVFYNCGFSPIQTDLFPSESGIMKCDIQYSGLQKRNLCSGKLKLISPAMDFPLYAQC